MIEIVGSHANDEIFVLVLAVVCSLRQTGFRERSHCASHRSVDFIEQREIILPEFMITFLAGSEPVAPLERK